MAYVLDGKALSERIREKLKGRVEALTETPGLAVLLVGDDPASHTYVGIKQKACEEVGIRFEQTLYNASVSEQELVSKIKELNARNDIHGILVQLPLPSQDPNNVIAAIDPKKDVDGFHRSNIEALKTGEPKIVSAVALGVMKLLEEAHKHQQKSKTAVIISSNLFAEPLIPLLDEQSIEAHVLHMGSADFAEQLKTADAIIVAVGKPGLITGDMIKPGAIVIDVGTTKIAGRLHGDADAASVSAVAGSLTPVPGGVGPMTVAMLLVNVLKAQYLQHVAQGTPQAESQQS